MGRVVKLSISLPAELAEELRKQAGAGRVSSFIEQAVARLLENTALGRILDDMDQDFGPVPEQEIRAATERMARLERRVSGS
ncbi:MAG: hypothetical protein M3010_09265 [Candidatus Dormibacteraeota bacterium]|nr:hypothetical protein [Candidatus Dormibacteraeota bacterium]